MSNCSWHSATRRIPFDHGQFHALGKLTQMFPEPRDNTPSQRPCISLNHGQLHTQDWGGLGGTIMGEVARDQIQRLALSETRIQYCVTTASANNRTRHRLGVCCCMVITYSFAQARSLSARGDNT